MKTKEGKKEMEKIGNGSTANGNLAHLSGEDWMYLLLHQPRWEYAIAPSRSLSHASSGGCWPVVW